MSQSKLPCSFIVVELRVSTYPAAVHVFFDFRKHISSLQQYLVCQGKWIKAEITPIRDRIDKVRENRMTASFPLKRK